MEKAASMRVALVSVVLVGLILVSTAHAARPEKLPAVVSPSIAPAVGEVVDAAINAVDLLGVSKMQEANPYTRGCSRINRCRG